jgi:hypothetical protein
MVALAVSPMITAPVVAVAVVASQSITLLAHFQATFALLAVCELGPQRSLAAPVPCISATPPTTPLNSYLSIIQRRLQQLVSQLWIQLRFQASTR